MKTWKTDLDNMVYLIRNESLLALQSLTQIFGEERLKSAQETFNTQLTDLMKSTFPHVTVKNADVTDQLCKANEILADKRTISLDSYYKGTYDLEISRLFEVKSGKTTFKGMEGRNGYLTLDKQIDKIKPDNYILVDDDAVGGATIKYVKHMLPHYVNIVDVYLLMNMYRNEAKEPILDVVDNRDFIAGIQNAGLLVQTNSKGNIRVPYIYPFVDIEDKANIPDELAIDVSIKLWKMNQEFWYAINPDIKLKELAEDFQTACSYYGIDLDTKMTVVCYILSNMSINGVTFESMSL